MNVADLLNPLPTTSSNITTCYRRSRCVSTPVIPSTLYRQQQRQRQTTDQQSTNNVIGKPRSRFSEREDEIICRGVAQGLTWGQISDLLPHRKRATCFNRYRTLQGIRKSRKLSSSSSEESDSLPSSPSMSPPSPVSSTFNNGPVTPPTSNYTHFATNQQWFSSSDVIYDQPSKPYYPTTEDSSFPRRSHKISLPALPPYHHRYSTTTITAASRYRL
ncbi:MAG: hypothetical protein EXX96DRAFT_494480 [Benjaminiella poitrasii]|nr:MAG: hypothetical protein EXX96DRAFT_494480 [Benjaminiella poitrasii]